MTSTSAGDVVLAAEVEHLLGLGDAADERAGEATGGRRCRLKTETGKRLFRCADEDEVAVAAEEAEIGVDVVVGGDAVEDEIEAAGVLRHLVGVAGDDDFVGTEAQGVVLLAGRGGEEDDVGSEGVRELDAHVAESAEADDADFLALADSPVMHRRVGGDAGAEQRRGPGEIEVRGDLEDETSRSTTMLSE